MSDLDLHPFFDEISSEVDGLIEMSLVEISNDFSLGANLDHDMLKVHSASSSQNDEGGDNDVLNSVALRKLLQRASIIFKHSDQISKVWFIQDEKIIFIRSLTDNHYLKTVCMKETLNFGILKYLLDKAEISLNQMLEVA